jgi:hypothetical protein
MSLRSEGWLEGDIIECPRHDVLPVRIEGGSIQVNVA